MSNKIYTNPELRTFEKELEPFRVTKNLRPISTKIKSDTVSYIDFEAYLVAKRVMTIPYGYKSASVVESRLRDYEELNEKFEQLKKLRRKTEFAKEQSTESYQ